MTAAAVAGTVSDTVSVVMGEGRASDAQGVAVVAAGSPDAVGAAGELSAELARRWLPVSPRTTPAGVLLDQFALPEPVRGVPLRDVPVVAPGVYAVRGWPASGDPPSPAASTGEVAVSLSALSALQSLGTAVPVLTLTELAGLTRLLPPSSRCVPSPAYLGSVRVYREWTQVARGLRSRFWAAVHARAHALVGSQLPAVAAGSASWALPGPLVPWVPWVAQRVASFGEVPCPDGDVPETVAFPLAGLSGAFFDNWQSTASTASASPAGVLDGGRGDREFLAAVEVSGVVLASERLWLAVIPASFVQCLQWLAPSPSWPLGAVPESVPFALLPQVLRNAAGLVEAGLPGPVMPLAWSLDR